MGVTDVCAVVELVVLVLLVHSIAPCVVVVVNKCHSIQRLNDDIVFS